MVDPSAALVRWLPQHTATTSYQADIVTAAAYKSQSARGACQHFSRIGQALAAFGLAAQMRIRRARTGTLQRAAGGTNLLVTQGITHTNDHRAGLALKLLLRITIAGFHANCK
jgi:hypothetical protein